jgi:hypothetical protein
LNHSELQHAWLRLRSGESLTPAEYAGLDAALKTILPNDVQSKTDLVAGTDLQMAEQVWLADDLLTDDLLSAVFAWPESAEFSASDYAAPTDPTDDFVERLRTRISESTLDSVIPLAVEPPPVIEHSVPLQVRGTPPASHEISPREQPMRLSELWVIAASAAVFLLALVAGVVFILNSNRDDKQQAIELNSKPDTAIKKELSSSIDSIAKQSNDIESGVRPANPVDVVQQDDRKPLDPAPNLDLKKQEHDPLVKDAFPSEKTNNDDAPPIPRLDQPEKMQPQESIADLNNSRSNPQFIATLTEHKNAVWRDGYAPEENLVAGPLSLESGEVTLRMARGAEVMFVGPIELELVDDNRITLNRGQLAADVPRAAIGFEVQTPGTRVVDLGTRFVVQVVPETSTQVDVLEGTVEVIQPDRRRKDREQKWQLTSGQSKWLSEDGKQNFDWRMVVQFGDRETAANQLTIDGQLFDVGRPDQAMLAMQRISTQLASASNRIEKLERGERFSGLLIVDGRQQKLATAGQLKSAQLDLMQRIQQRWTKNMFEQVFPQGVPGEMQDFFNNNGFPFFE